MRPHITNPAYYPNATYKSVISLTVYCLTVSTTTSLLLKVYCLFQHSCTLKNICADISVDLQSCSEKYPSGMSLSISFKPLQYNTYVNITPEH